jgi:hypothetical protein
MYKLKTVNFCLLIAIVISAIAPLSAYAKPAESSYNYPPSELTFTCSNCYAYELKITGTVVSPEGPIPNATWDSGRKAQPVNNWNPRYPNYSIPYGWYAKDGFNVSFVISGNGYTFSRCSNKLYLPDPHAYYVHITWTHGRDLIGTCSISSSARY